MYLADHVNDAGNIVVWLDQLEGTADIVPRKTVFAIHVDDLADGQHVGNDSRSVIFRNIGECIFH
jgi:hypothetical protein